MWKFLPLRYGTFVQQWTACACVLICLAYSMQYMVGSQMSVCSKMMVLAMCLQLGFKFLPRKCSELNTNYPMLSPKDGGFKKGSIHWSWDQQLIKTYQITTLQYMLVCVLSKWNNWVSAFPCGHCKKCLLE